MRWLIALGLVLSIGMALPTQAADCPAVRGIAYAECDDEGEAYAAASAAAADQAQVSNAAGGIVWVPMVEAEGNAYVGFIRRSTASTGRTASSKRAWKTKCSARPEEFGWAGGETSASVNVCERGCMYTSSLDPQGAAGYSYSPTGATCTTSDAPAPTPAGDGTDPGGGGGETGGGDGGGTNPGGGDGDGGGGTNPGGGDGGGGTGPGDGDGGGDDGGGDGGGGTGPGPGPGEGDGDGDGPGAPGEDGGPLYEHDKNLTIPKVYAEFEQRVKKAPIIDATKRFFTVSVGGSCPVFTVPASAYWEAMTFDLHCSGAIFALLQLIGWVLLAMAAYKAGEIALT